MSLMIKNAHAILSGLPGEAARLAGPDIRIRDGKIAAIGSLTGRATDRCPRLRDLSGMGEHAPPSFSVAAEGRAAGAEPEPDGLAERHAVPLSRGFR
jgi:hypothetical protein